MTIQKEISNLKGQLTKTMNRVSSIRDAYLKKDKYEELIRDETYNELIGKACKIAKRLSELREPKTNVPE